MSDIRKRRWDDESSSEPRTGKRPDDGLRGKELALKTASELSSKLKGLGEESHLFVKDIEINDIRNRYLLTKGSTQSDIHRDTGATVVTKGTWYPDKTMATERDPPLYLHITAETGEALQQAITKVEQLISQELGPLTDSRTNRDREREWQMNNGGSTALTVGGGVPQQRERRKWPEARITVGLESFRNFNLRHKIVGPQGMFVKFIQTHSGSRVQVKGHGSGFIDTVTGQEHDEPLHVYVAAPQVFLVEKAVVMVKDLLDTVAEKHAAAMADSGGQSYNNYNAGYNNNGYGNTGYAAQAYPSAVPDATQYAVAGAYEQPQAQQAQAYASAPQDQSQMTPEQWTAYWNSLDPAAQAYYTQYYSQYYSATAAAAPAASVAAVPVAAPPAAPAPEAPAQAPPPPPEDDNLPPPPPPEDDGSAPPPPPPE